MDNILGCVKVLLLLVEDQRVVLALELLKKIEEFLSCTKHVPRGDKKLDEAREIMQLNRLVKSNLDLLKSRAKECEAALRDLDSVSKIMDSRFPLFLPPFSFPVLHLFLERYI